MVGLIVARLWPEWHQQSSPNRRSETFRDVFRKTSGYGRASGFRHTVRIPFQVSDTTETSGTARVPLSFTGEGPTGQKEPSAEPLAS